MSIYQKLKVHRGPMSKCSQCMAKVAAQDPAFAAAFTKTAQAAEKTRRGKQ
jgi:hypothetical protein